MQWADASLLDFVEYLLDWSRNSPIFVITLARPELLERRPTWGAGQRNFTSLYLEPLAAAGDGGAADRPRARAARRRSATRSSPAPRASRCTRSRRCGCCSTAACSSQDGAAYRLTGPVEALEVPETLHALIAARLDGLSAEERRLLQDAAVLGKTFTTGRARVARRRPSVELEPLLASLVRKEVLGVQADPRSPEHGQYGFLQDLVRHVAYETLSKRERRARHLAAAAHLRAALRRGRGRGRRGDRLALPRRLRGRPRRRRRGRDQSEGAGDAGAGRRARGLARARPPRRAATSSRRRS